MRITYVLHQFPQLSETYANTEIRSLAREHEIEVVSLNPPDVLGATDATVVGTSNHDAIVDRARAFGTEIVHTHWLGSQLEQACALAAALDVPLTVRAHSFDVLWPEPERRFRGFGPRRPDRSKPIKKNLDFLRSEGCLGILAFPFSIDRLIRAGLPEQKLHPSWPVLDFDRFHDRGPNARGILNGGALLPKKDFGAYLEFAARLPSERFSLYPIGADRKPLERINHALGSPVDLQAPVPHAAMPAVYKDHDWLVYTADPRLRTVGWPVCAMEAMASGVVVCMPNLRPDLKDYLGDAGLVYDSLEELAPLLQAPPSEALRVAGFERARRADVARHVEILEDLWRAAPR